MNIFNKVTLQSMKKSRTRTIVTVIGVILSTAMITAVATFGTSLLQFLIDGSIVKSGDWHVEFFDAPSSFVQERADDQEVVNTAEFSNIGYAVLDGAKTPEKPYVFIAGFNEKTFDTLPINLISGRLPEGSDEILIPAHVASKGGVRLAVGDSLSLMVGIRREGEETLGQHDPYRSGDTSGTGEEILVPEEEKHYTVVGTYERPGFEEHAAPGYTLITREHAAEPGGSFSVFVALKNPRKAKVYADSIAGEGTYILNNDILRFMGASEDKFFNAILYSVGGILVTIIMVGSIFLIYNSFNISLNERIHQFGILASVGATAKQLRNSVLFEGLCIGAVGIPAGIAAGIGSIGLVIPVVARRFESMVSVDVPLGLSVSFPALILAAAVSLLTILISAYIPARKATNTPVMESIRQTNEIRTEPKAMKTPDFLQRIYGLEGTLAQKNFRRNKKRYRSIVLSLVLSVVLFVSGNAFGTTLKRLSKEAIVDIDYDILFYSEGMDDGERSALYEKMKSAGGVYESLSQTVYEYFCIVNPGDLSDRYREYAGLTAAEEPVAVPMYLQFIEDSEYIRFLESKGLPEEEYTGQGANVVAFARQKVHNEGGNTTEVFDVFANDSVICGVSPEADGRQGAKPGHEWKAAIVDEYSVDPPPMPHDKQNPLVIIMTVPYSLKGNFDVGDSRAYVGLGFYSRNPLQSVSELETIIQEVGLTTDYTLYSIYAILDTNRNLIFVIDVFTYLFVIMISLIAVANVFNTISTNIRLRRRELAMLRSIGMCERDFNKMMCFECAFYGMRTLLFGLPAAGILSWLIYKGIMAAEKLETLPFEFPWGSMGISVAGVFFIVFVTMLYAVRKIKKENIIDALRDDMT